MPPAAQPIAVMNTASYDPASRTSIPIMGPRAIASDPIIPYRPMPVPSLAMGMTSTARVAAEVESAPKLMPCSARTMPTSASALNSRYPSNWAANRIPQTRNSILRGNWSARKPEMGRMTSAPIMYAERMMPTTDLEACRPSSK